MDSLLVVIGSNRLVVVNNLSTRFDNILRNSYTFDCVEIYKVVDSMQDHEFVGPNRVPKYINDLYFEACILVDGQDTCDFLNA